MTRDMNALMLNIKSNNAILMKKVIVTFVVHFLKVYKDNRNRREGACHLTVN